MNQLARPPVALTMAWCDMVFSSRSSSVSRRGFLSGIVSVATALIFPGALRAEARTAFPVTLNHALGDTSLETEPRRIVVIGWNGEDIALALGKIPLAVPRRVFFESGSFPWNERFYGTNRPLLLDENEVDFETIASLSPDLILAVLSGITRRDYERLSKIAPTVAYRSGPWKADWKEQTELVGLALGQSEKATSLIIETENLIDDLGNRHPELRGLSFVFGQATPSSASFRVYLPGSARVDMLIRTGLVAPPGIAALAKDYPGRGEIDISLERLDLLDSDILVLASGLHGYETINRQPLLAFFRPVRNGDYVLLDDPELLWASSALSVLSIRDSYPKLVSEIARAARRFHLKQE